MLKKSARGGADHWGASNSAKPVRIARVSQMSKIPKCFIQYVRSFSYELCPAQLLIGVDENELDGVAEADI